MTDGRDDAVERVLRGLREAEGAPGMEVRVLARLAAAGLEAERLGVGRGGFRNPPFRAWEVVAGAVRKDGAPGELAGGWRLAGAVLVAVVVAGGIWGGVGTDSGSAAGLPALRVGGSSLSAAAGRSAGGWPGQAGEGAASPSAEGGARWTSADAGGRGARGAAAFAGITRPLLRGTGDSLPARERDLGERGLSEKAVESFPAPPMPLTRQERLLLRMLRGGESAELVATLSSEAGVAMQRQDGLRRQQFFAPDRPELEAERKANGIKDADAPVDGIGHMGPALKSTALDDGNAMGNVREKE